MINNDNDRLLQQFFSEAAHQQIPDDGFTDRVMQRIAVKAGFQTNQKLQTSNIKLQTSNIRAFSRLWTVFCVLVFAVLFVWFRGWEALAIHFEVMLRTLSVQPLSINISVLFAVVFGLLFVGAGEVISSESARS